MNSNMLGMGVPMILYESACKAFKKGNISSDRFARKLRVLGFRECDLQREIELHQPPAGQVEMFDANS